MGFDKLDMGIPSQGYFHLPNRADRALRRVMTSAFPVTGSSFAPNGVREIRFSIPQSTAYLDLASIFVSGLCVLSNNTGGACNAGIQQEGIGNAIQRILIKANGVVLEDLQDAQKLYRMLSKLVPVDFNDSVGRMTMLKDGSGTATINDGASASLEFALPLSHSSVCSSGHFLPLGLMNSVEISLFLNTTEGEVVATDNAEDVKYSLSQVKLQYDEVYMPNEYNEEMLRFLGSGESISLHVNQYKIHLDNLKNSTNNILTISEYVESLKSLFFYMETQTVLDDKEKPNVMRDNQINQFQLKNGSNNYPQLPVDCANKAEVYSRLLQAAGMLHNVLGGTTKITYSNYLTNTKDTPDDFTDANLATFTGELASTSNTSNSIFGLNIENHIGGLVSGPMSELLTLDIRLAASSSDQVVITTLYDKFITISGTGQIDVRE
jgi:hypothetical protein